MKKIEIMINRACFKFAILGLFLMTMKSLKAQTNEVLYTHFDQPFYIVGDEAWFKIYLLGNATVNSSIIHAEFVSPDGTVLNRQNLKVMDKTAHGFFKIPIDWQDGQYLFRAYTLWQNDSVSMPKAFVSKKIIPIYNDLIEAKNEEVKVVSNIEPFNMPSVVGEYSITSEDKKVYKRREKVSLTLSLKDRQDKPVEGDLSVSIVENTPLSSSDLLESFQETQSGLSNKSVKKELLTPEKELTLLGKVKDDKNPKPITDQYLSLYFPTLNQFRRLTAKDGFFKTPLPFFESKTDIQVLSLNPNMSYPLSIESIFSIDLPSYKSEKMPLHSPTMDAYLKQNNKRRRANDIFNISTVTASTQDSSKAKEPIVADKSYDLKNFMNLTTVEDFIREVIYFGQITRKNDKKTVRLQNKDNSTIYTFAPWYVVDGLFIEDEEQVLNIPISEVLHIDIFNQKKSIEKNFDWLMFRYGVIAITTKKNNRALSISNVKKSTIEGFTASRNWREATTTDSKTPDFRTLLTWQSDIKTNKSGSTTLSFTTGDIKGKFAVRVIGKTMEGKPICGVLFIEVI
jgi:hypothetical protein